MVDGFVENMGKFHLDKKYAPLGGLVLPRKRLAPAPLRGSPAGRMVLRRKLYAPVVLPPGRVQRLMLTPD